MKWQQYDREHRILEEIAAVETIEFAEMAKKTLDPVTHAYSFEDYLELLDNLKTLLYAGMPPGLALDAVQTGLYVDHLLCFITETVIEGEERYYLKPDLDKFFPQTKLKQEKKQFKKRYGFNPPKNMSIREATWVMENKGRITKAFEKMKKVILDMREVVEQGIFGTVKKSQKIETEQVNRQENGEKEGL
jgi:hypothetical protein